jgi:competence protein ComEA
MTTPQNPIGRAHWALLLLLAGVLLVLTAPLAAGCTAAGVTAEPHAEIVVSESAGGTVHVHVAGAVQAPGLAELPAGSRVADAIEQAGGTAPDAAVEGVNLARVLVDGEQILVPRQGEQAGAAQAGSAGADPDQSGMARVNLNTATLEQLDALPGVGPAIAQRIIDSRQTEGPFRQVDDLTRVDGIGAKTLERLRDQVTV